MEWFIGSVIVALIFSLFFSQRKKKAKAAEGMLWFFLLFLFPLWAFSIWVPPIGPVFQGIAWLDILVVAVLISLGIFIFTPKDNEGEDKENLSKLDKYGNKRKSRAMSGLFWMFSIFMIVIIAVGYLQTKA